MRLGAHGVGLVNEPAEPGGPLAAALDLAGPVTAGVLIALAAGKQLVDRRLGMELDTAISHERETSAVASSCSGSAKRSTSPIASASEYTRANSPASTARTRCRSPSGSCAMTTHVLTRTQHLGRPNRSQSGSYLSR